MTDSYPESFTIEIEREKLCRYLRLEVLCGSLLPCTFFGSYFGLVTAFQRYASDNIDLWTRIPLRMGAGFVIGSAVALVVYAIFGHTMSRLRANGLEVSVEGAYLRISEGVFMRNDRKLHFRSLVDYSCFSGPLMRFCRVEGILLNTTAGGRYSTLCLKGIKNALEVRDMLSEIDRMRENG
jgi:hypothetical protein